MKQSHQKLSFLFSNANEEDVFESVTQHETEFEVIWIKTLYPTSINQGTLFHSVYHAQVIHGEFTLRKWITLRITPFTVHACFEEELWSIIAVGEIVDTITQPCFALGSKSQSNELVLIDPRQNFWEMIWIQRFCG